MCEVFIKKISILKTCKKKTACVPFHNFFEQIFYARLLNVRIPRCRRCMDDFRDDGKTLPKTTTRVTIDQTKVCLVRARCVGCDQGNNHIALLTRTNWKHRRRWKCDVLGLEIVTFADEHDASIGGPRMCRMVVAQSPRLLNDLAWHQNALTRTVVDVANEASDTTTSTTRSEAK